MAPKDLDSSYWNDRYKNNTFSWDLGEISPPLKSYIDKLQDKNLSILIPGCGRGHEGIYLWDKGFRNITFLDFSPLALAFIKESRADIPDIQLLSEDFFKHKGQYDLIIEQTLFCTFHPSQRSKYAQQIHALLAPGGRMIGLFFEIEFESGPPFGGTREQYLSYFEPLFSKVKMTPCYNSIPPRQGSELFVQLEK